MGWLSIGVGLIWGVSKIWDKFSPPKGVVIEQLAALKGVSTSEARDSITNSDEFKKFKDEIEKNDFDKDMQETILKKGFERIGTKLSIEEINRSSISQVQKAARIEAIKENYNNASSDIDKSDNLSEDDIEKSNDFTEANIPLE